MLACFPFSGVSDSDSQTRMAMVIGPPRGDTEQTLETIREEDVGYGGGNVKETKEKNRGIEYDIQAGGVNLEVENEKGGEEKCEPKVDYDDMKEGGSIEDTFDEGGVKKDQSERTEGIENVPVNHTRLHEVAANNQDETGTRSEMLDLEEESTPVQVDEPGYVEDIVTPVLKLVIFNIILPLSLIHI